MDVVLHRKVTGSIVVAPECVLGDKVAEETNICLISNQSKLSPDYLTRYTTLNYNILMDCMYMCSIGRQYM